MSFRAFVAAVAIVAVFPSTSAAFQIPLLPGPSLETAVAEQARPHPLQAPPPPVPRPFRLGRQLPYPYPYPYPPIRRGPRPELTDKQKTAVLVVLTVVGGIALTRAIDKR